MSKWKLLMIHKVHYKYSNRNHEKTIEYIEQEKKVQFCN